MTKEQTLFAIAGLSAVGYLIYKTMWEKLPRGYRNNNPLNIRYVSGNNWMGRVLPNTDGVFEQFKSMAYGYRAALFLFRKYISNGTNTVQAIVSKWAPANENNTTGYISTVCSLTGYSSGTIIDPSNEEQMCNLAYAMSIVENGWSPEPSMAQIKQGYSLL